MSTLFTKTAGAFLSLLLLCHATGFAHAFVDHAEPKVGGRGPSPKHVRIWYTQAIEPAFSGMKVLDAQGRQVDNKDGRQDASDKKLVVVSLPALPPGVYTVVWHVLSVDTHKSSGDFKFTVTP